MRETWKPVVGYEGHYEVSSLGRIYSIKTKRIRKQAHVNSGYMSINLWKNNRQKNRFTHSVVCEAFHGPRPEGMTASHLNSIKVDNREENLCWETLKDNMDKPETKLAISEAAKKWHRNNPHPLLGKKRPQTVRDKISATKRGIAQ